MSRNARVLELILQQAGVPLGRTRLLKLAYMADLLAWRVLGEPLSEFRYLRYKQGPFDPDFYAAVEELDEDGRATEEPITTAEGHDGFLVRMTAPPDPSCPSQFTPGQRHLVDLVVSRYREVKFDDLLGEVYETEPMQTVDFGEPLPMEEQKNKDRDAAGGISLETILESRERFKRGEGVSFEEFKREFLG